MMNSRMHFGMNGIASCGLSKLLVLKTTQDIQAVDCRACLWHVIAEMNRQIQGGLAQIDVVLARCKVVTDEDVNALVIKQITKVAPGVA